MLNKKLLVAVALIAALSSTKSFAKTEGNYFGVDLLRTSADFQYSPRNGYPQFNQTAIGVGAHYSHAFNFDGIFLAPGVFVEKNQVRASDKDGDKYGLNYRSGIKLDLGYDVTKSFSPYITGGLSHLNYTADFRTGSNGSAVKKSDSSNGAFYGIGFLYHVAKEFTINAEYNIQSNNNVRVGKVANSKAGADIQVIKLGASYHF